MKKLVFMAIAVASMLGSTPASAEWDGDGYYMIQNISSTTNQTNENRYIALIGKTYDVSWLYFRNAWAFKDCIKMMSSTCDTTELGEPSYHSEAGAVIRVSSVAESDNSLSAQDIDFHTLTGNAWEFEDNGDGTYKPYFSIGNVTRTKYYLQDYYGLDLALSDDLATFQMKKVDGTNEYFGATATTKIGDYYYTTLRTAFNYRLSEGMNAYIVSDYDGTLQLLVKGGEIVNAGTKVILQCTGRTAKENQLFPTTEKNSSYTSRLTNRLISGYSYFHYVNNPVVITPTAIATFKKYQLDEKVNDGSGLSDSFGTCRIMSRQDDGNLGFYQTYKDWAAKTDSNIACLDGNKCYMEITSDVTLVGKPAGFSNTGANVGQTVTVTIARNAEMNENVGWIEYSLDGGKTWTKTDDGTVTITSPSKTEVGKVTLLARMNNNGVASDPISTDVAFGEQATLSSVAAAGDMRTIYHVTGNGLKSVGHFTALNGDKYLVVTDSDKSYTNYVDVNSSTFSGTENLWSGSNNDEIDQKAFTQNNWALLKVSDTDYDKVDVTISNFTATLTDNCNMVFDAYSVTEGDEEASQKLNIYTPLNFYLTDHLVWTKDESSLVKHAYNSTTGETHNYFLMPPKRSELVEIHWLVLADDGKFYLPKDKAYNPYGWAGGVKPDWEYNQWDVAGKLTVNRGYNITAIVKSVQTIYPGTDDAPRRAASTDVEILPNTGELVSDQYIIYPINVQSEEQIITAVSDITAVREVQSVSYYDLTGRQSAEPFEGVNVVVTRYTDGTSTVCKVLSTK